MPVTQQDIADALGTSRGTVDRVLNNRGRVNPELKARILEAAQAMGYRPNTAGRALAMARQSARIGVILQSAETPFMARVMRGVNAGMAEAARLGLGVEVHRLEGMNAERSAALLREIIDEGCVGAALVPSEGEAMRQALREAADRDLPVVTFNVDIGDEGQLCFVGQNSEQAGRTAAGLMAELLPPDSKLLVISGNPSNAAHQARVEGFRQEMARLRGDVEVPDTEYDCDSADVAREIAHRALTEVSNLQGIYVAAAGVIGVCDALAARNCAGKLRLISHDLVEDNIERLMRGEISFLIGQDPFAQGYRPLKILIDRIIDGQLPPARREYTHIDIRTRYNCRT